MRALITGAGKGIGRAVAMRLSRDYESLVLMDIDAAAVADVVRELGALTHVETVVGSVASSADCRRAMHPLGRAANPRRDRGGGRVSRLARCVFRDRRGCARRRRPDGAPRRLAEERIGRTSRPALRRGWRQRRGIRLCRKLLRPAGPWRRLQCLKARRRLNARGRAKPGASPRVERAAAAISARSSARPW